MGSAIRAAGRVDGRSAQSNHPRCWRVLGALCAALVLSWVSPARAVVSSNGEYGPFTGVYVNYDVGAYAFYYNNFFGGTALLANVEAGHIWNGHQALESANITYIPGPLDTPRRQYDWHATMVGHVMGANIPGLELWGGWWFSVDDGAGGTFTYDPGAFLGMAPHAQLWSAAISTGWEPTAEPDYLSGSFNTTARSFLSGYESVMKPNALGKKADVINSSWGGIPSTSGNTWENLVLDALVYKNHTTLVFAAGNAGTKVDAPASGYNMITVAALEDDLNASPYRTVASFSNRGPGDYFNPVTNVTIPNVRATVHIAAPGTNMTLAMYAGLTGGHTSGTDYDWTTSYFVDQAGTSFAAPVIAGAAALIVDAGKMLYPADPHAIDGRIVKVVMMNSADKLPGWDNGQVAGPGGVITTIQGLDWTVGAGKLNLNRAYTQYTTGTTGTATWIGPKAIVEMVGWDMSAVDKVNTIREYALAQTLLSGYKLTTTLNWFVERDYAVLGDDPLTGDILSSADDVQFARLFLQVLRVVDGGDPVLVAQSISPYDNLQHLYFPIEVDGQYIIRVKFDGMNYELGGDPTGLTDYGLAWMVEVPEPGMGVLLVGVMIVTVKRRRRLAA